ncbi:MAG TPA: hypothetical protein VF613_25595 [Longimicrobium sp.]|jgi:hypothetical protein
MQKIGEGLGGLVGQAADNAFGMFGAMMNNMGGWWAQAANPQQQGQGGGSVHASFNSEADNRCRTHFEAHGRAQGSSAGGAAGGASGSTAGGASGSTGGAAGSTQSGLHVDAQGSQGGGLHIDAQSGSSGRTRSYEDARPLYQFGHMASQNPDYQGRGFHEVEPDLQRHWGSEQTQQHGAWPDVRGFVEFGYSGNQQK